MPVLTCEPRPGVEKKLALLAQDDDLHVLVQGETQAAVDKVRARVSCGARISPFS